MPSAWVLPNDVIDEVDKRADGLKEKAFPNTGHFHFYSGPREAVAEQILGITETNHDRAIEWAKVHGATIIDNTPIGEFLDKFEGVGLFKYFEKNPLIPVDKKFESAILPWKHLSRLFALAASEHVTTTTCGASDKGVYLSVELRNLLNPDYNGLSATEFLQALLVPRKKPIEDINMIAFNRVKHICDNRGYEAAQHLIALGEQRMSLHEALITAKPRAIREALNAASAEVLRCPAEAYRYFLVSQEQYQVDRALRMAGTPIADRPVYAQTADVRQTQRDAKLAHFAENVLALIETEIALMPKAVRPDFIVPAYLVRKTPR